MKYTSAEAAKLLRSLNEELGAVVSAEMATREFVAATTEDVESVRPKYDFAESQKEIERLQKEIRKVKHAINVFNTTTVIPELGMTIDEALVFMPQLSSQKVKLSSMRSRQAKTREYARSASSIIEYRYANYDVEAADAEFKRVSDLLAKAQTALDVINNSVKFEI
ncbi:MAG: hypothetical protein J1F39_00890 [Clostridiales bacterium]|nr:hypothetical protein [Clostridiales bacterium]